MKERKKATSIRLSEEGKQLRKLLAERLGLSESAVIELALRRLAEMEGVKRDKNV
jgi:predicted DNA-binding protein